MVFDFDFRATCLSSASKQQLTNIQKAVNRGSTAAKQRSRLLRLIESHAYAPAKGFYVPVSPHVYLDAKLPIYSEGLGQTDFPKEPFPYCFFTNPLVIPHDFGTDGFDADSALEPKNRATNAGWLIVTIEHDCQTPEQLEECLGWVRGKDDDLDESLFAEVDRALKRFKEYRGFTTVFSGNKSLHVHLLFSTKHLENAPWDLSAEERLAQSHAELMTQVHAAYWDTSTEIFGSVLHPSLDPDRQLRILSQWRRSPWSIRILDKPSVALGLPIGAVIPQMVIHESMMSRASPKADHYLVPPEFKPKQSCSIQPRTRTRTSIQVVDEKLLNAIKECCREEGGEFPKPATVNHDGRDWVIKFWNNPHDKKPSTIVRGSCRKLLLCGAHSFAQNFYLPDHMSADEMCGAVSNKQTSQTETRNADTAGKASVTVGQSLKERLQVDSFERYFERIHDDFAEPIAETDQDTIKATHRDRLANAISRVRNFPAPLIIRAPEGIGKTRGLFAHVALDVLDAAMSRNPDHGQKFACHASASIEQTEAKAEEYRALGPYRQAMVVKSFWKHYGIVCEELSLQRIPRLTTG